MASIALIFFLLAIYVTQSISVPLPPTGLTSAGKIPYFWDAETSSHEALRSYTSTDEYKRAVHHAATWASSPSSRKKVEHSGYMSTYKDTWLEKFSMFVLEIFRKSNIHYISRKEAQLEA